MAAQGRDETTSTMRTRRSIGSRRGAGRVLLLAGLLIATAIATMIVTFVLVTMFEHKQEERVPFVRVVEVDETTTDPEPWGKNWPHQYNGYQQTSGGAYYGGSSAMPASKLEEDPWLKRLYSGYAFSLDYREARGHAFMLFDQTVTERVTKRSQSGACLHCHASTTVMYRQVGLQEMGMPTSDEVLAADFNMPAVIKGFEKVSRMPYHEVLRMVAMSPDGTPGENEPMFPELRDAGLKEELKPEGYEGHWEAHPVSCVDCHDPESMAIRITRPGFVLGVQMLAESDDPLPHLPSIEKWREGPRNEPYDPNRLASRQEMRSFVCAQCHVEYYCANKMTLEFPWSNGLKAEQLEQHWDETTFPDGTPFFDYVHGETGARLHKVQHPEFELWSQGVHAQSGVSCADCHMPYERQGAMKISSHNIQSPLETVNNSCQQCHNVSEAELLGRVDDIQNRTVAMKQRAAVAMTDMLDAILEAKAAGATDQDLAHIYDLQRKAMWRLDYISSENSKGFHAGQESVRILGESIDFSRQAQTAALRWRAPDAPSTEAIPKEPVYGVTPEGEAPPADDIDVDIEGGEAELEPEPDGGAD